MTARWTTTIAAALLGAAAVGVLAGSFNPGHFAVTAVVFAACTLAPLGALGWVLLVAPQSVPQDRNAADNVENRWAERAAAAAFLDLVVLLGLGLAAVSITGTSPNAQLVLLGVLVVTMVDVGLRYVLLARVDR